MRKGRRSRIAVLAVGVAVVAVLLVGIQGQATRAASPTPPVTAGLQLWYEADTTAYTDGQAVTSWADKSGLGRDLTSSGTFDAPIMRRNAVNGRAAIEFNGSSSLMKTYGSTFTLTQPTTFFVVYRSLDANTSARAFVFDSRNSQQPAGLRPGRRLRRAAVRRHRPRLQRHHVSVPHLPDLERHLQRSLVQRLPERNPGRSRATPAARA